MIEILIKLATDLDRTGLADKADFIDDLLGEPEVLKLANENGGLEISEMSPEEAFGVAIEAIRMGLIPNPRAGNSDSKKREDTGNDEEPENEQVEFGDWQTENFDLCPGAVKAFEALSEMHGEHEDATSSVSGDTYEELVVAAMGATDDLLGLEKEVLESKSSSQEQLEKTLELARTISHYIGVLSEVTSKQLDSNFEFLDMHVKVIAEHLGSSDNDLKDAEND